MLIDCGVSIALSVELTDCDCRTSDLLSCRRRGIASSSFICYACAMPSLDILCSGACRRSLPPPGPGHSGSALFMQTQLAPNFHSYRRRCLESSGGVDRCSAESAVRFRNRSNVVPKSNQIPRQSSPLRRHSSKCTSWSMRGHRSQQTTIAMQCGLGEGTIAA